MKLLRNKNIVIYFTFFIGLLIFKWQFIDLPYFSEEKPYAIFNVFNFSFWEILTHSYKPGAFADHHTLLPLICAPIIKLFGTDPFNVHFLMYAISILGITYFIKTLQLLAPTKKNIYWIAPFALILFPDYFIHMSNLRYEMLAATLSIMAIYYRISQRMGAFFICSLLLSQTRETVLAFFATFILLDLIFFYKSNERVHLKFLGLSLICIAAWASFFILHYSHHGIISSSPASDQIVSSLSEYLTILLYDFKWYFLIDSRWAFSLMSLISIFILFKRKEKIRIEVLYFVLPLIFYAFGMAFHVFEAHYYLYPVLYCLYALFIYFLFRLEMPFISYPIYILILVINFFYLDNYKAKESVPEDSTVYKEVTNNYKEIYKVLNQKYSNKVFNIEWPLIYYFQDPNYGYHAHNDLRIRSHFDNNWSPVLGHKQINWELKNEDCPRFRKKFDGIVVLKHGNDLHREYQEYYAFTCHYKMVEQVGSDLHFGRIYLLED